jgi:predicted DNA binding CopG/RHH family protein
VAREKKVMVRLNIEELKKLQSFAGRHGVGLGTYFRMMLNRASKVLK